MTIKAIETVYNGYRFRSRLEARWAVFFDTLGIPYEYEQEGYQLDSGWYLPDFKLPGFNFPTWFEVKGPTPDLKEGRLAYELAEKADGFVYIAFGECWLPIKNTIGIKSFRGYPYGKEVYFKTCPFCDYLVIGYRPLEECDHCKGVTSLNAPQLREAYTAARQARFEHGECG